MVPYLKSSTLDLLHANHIQWQQLVKHKHSVNNHFGEKPLLLMDKLRAKGGGGALLKESTVLNSV